MYSEKLQKEKILVPKDEMSIIGVNVSEKDLHMMIDTFCRKDDVIGVPTKKLFELFDAFCSEHGYNPISHLALGRVFRKHFNLTRKRVRCGQELYWVYVSAD